jgi:hypothetical protein
MRKGPLTSNAEVSKIPEQGSTFDAVTNIFRLARTIYMRCTYGVFGRAITKYTVINGVYILKRCVVSRVGQNHVYCRCGVYTVLFGRAITKFTVIYIYGSGRP